VVDLLVSTAADIKESTKEPDEGPAPAKETREKKFTPVAFNDEVAKRVAVSLKTTLKKATRSLYESTEQSLSVRAIVSRTYESGDEKWFWYAFHPNYRDALKDYKKSFVAFGCGSPDSVLLFPLEIFVGWLKDLNVTRDEEREYYHVRLGFFPEGHVRLLRKERKPAVDVTQFLLK
jgi:hypothetical protein